jgi:Flp pilus assembly protein TadG
VRYPPTRFLRARTGAVAAEFAMVIPVMLLITLGTINLGIMTYAFSALHFAVEAGARCGAIDTTNCASDSSAQTFAAGKYKGPDISPAFAGSNTGSCYQMVGTGTFHFVTGVASLPVSMSATACYPLQPS